MAQVRDLTTSVVGIVKAIDPDSGQVLSYKVISGDPEKFFTIDSRNGTIRVRNSAYSTFSNSRTWKLVVAVTDSDAENPLTTNITVTIILNKNTQEKSIDPKMAGLK